MISEAVINDIKNKSDIVDVFDLYINLIQKAKNFLMYVPFQAYGDETNG